MKKQILMATVSACLMALPSIASANDDDNGWYLRGNVGYGAITDTDFTGDLVGSTQGEGNVAGSFGIGYDFDNNWRLELDGFQLWNDMGFLGANTSSSDLRLTTGMLNAIYDFSDFGNWEPYIGAGIGIARARLSAQAHAAAAWGSVTRSAACPNADICVFDRADTGTAWQLLAGLGYNISDKLVWDTQYRYLNVGDLDFDGAGRNLTAPINAGVFGSASNIASVATGAGAHSLLTGLRYRFGGGSPRPEPVMYTCWDGSSVEDMSSCPAEPPKVEYTTCWDGSQVEVGTACPARPVVNCWDGSTADSQANCPARPVTVQCWDGSTVSDASQCPAQRLVQCWDGSTAASAAACPVQTYEQQLCANEYRQEIIYYEFNKPQSAETHEKIKRILDTGKYCDVQNIHVVGHTDSSGSAAYNLALSKRRAADVRRELIRQGIPSAKITSEGKGETQPFVDRGDGVKEPLNRRTEVLIRLGSTGVVN